MLAVFKCGRKYITFRISNGSGITRNNMPGLRQFGRAMEMALPSWSRFNPNGAAGEDLGDVLKPKLDPKLDA